MLPTFPAESLAANQTITEALSMGIATKAHLGFSAE
jgi:hypothetical protein